MRDVGIAVLDGLDTGIIVRIGLGAGRDNPCLTQSIRQRQPAYSLRCNMCIRDSQVAFADSFSFTAAAYFP